jgi:putative ABC transport system permease protein
MNSEMDSFIVVSAIVLVLLSLVAGGIAIAGSVLYRSTLLRKEVATRRVLGARRSHIACMFLSENVLGLAAGIAAGILAMLVIGESQRAWFLAIVLGSAAMLVIAGLVCGWIAGRHASKVPFSESGLFRTSSDTRGR